MIVTEYTLPEQLLARLKEQVQSAVEVMNNASEVSVGWGCCQLLNVIKSTEAKILHLEGPGKPKDQAQKEKAEKEVQKQKGAMDKAKTKLMELYGTHLKGKEPEPSLHLTKEEMNTIRNILQVDETGSPIKPQGVLHNVAR